MESKTFVFFGIVGSGKGTQVSLLTEFLKKNTQKEVVYAGTGEGFRKLVNSDKYSGNILKEKMNKGELIADFFANSIITNVLSEEVSPDKHLILDGYPRTVTQSEIFEEMMSFFNREDIHIIYIELSEAEAMKRNLLRGRHDDTEEGLKKRFEEYKNNVIPAMNYFKEKVGYKIHTINGEQSIEDVHRDIMSSLNL